jgi:SET family sugar efflux transporter-like MFS transporter
MVGPAAAYAVADAFGKPVVFRMALVLALGWALLWWTVVPRHVAIVPAAKAEPGERGRTDVALRWAGVFVFLMGLAHSLTSAALPLFYVQEVGLPGYAPGLAFTMKTAAEIPAVLSTPFLIARFGPRRALFAVVALATVAIVVLASVRTFPQMLAAAALEGVYYGLYASLGISFVQSFAEDRPARGTASYWNAQMLSGILAGPAVGLVAQLASFHAVIQAASVIAALAAVPLALSVVRRR